MDWRRSQMSRRPLRMNAHIMQIDGRGVAVVIRALQPPETVCEGALQPDETCRGLAENRALLCGGESWRLEDGIDRRRAGNRKSEVGADDNLAGTRRRDDVSQILRAVHERVEVKLRTAEIVARFALHA